MFSIQVSTLWFKKNALWNNENFAKKMKSNYIPFLPYESFNYVWLVNLKTETLSNRRFSFVIILHVLLISCLKRFFFITFLLQSRNIRLIFRHIDMFSTCVLWYAWWKFINLSFIYMYLYISIWCDNTGLLLFFGVFFLGGGSFWMLFFIPFFQCVFLVVVVVIVELSVESEMCLFLETCFMNQMTLVRPMFCIVQFWVYRVAVNTLQRDVYFVFTATQ